MATITLDVGKKFVGLELTFKGTTQKVSDLATALSKLKSKVDTVKTVTDVGSSSNAVSNANNREEHKKSALSVAYQKIDELLSNVGSIDDRVAGKITKRKDNFYKKYSWLKPECEKGLFEKAKDYLWHKVCTIANKIKNIVIDVAKWCKKHWKAIVTALIIVVAIVLICTGVGGILGAAAIGALIGAGAGGLFGGVMSAANGGSFWEGFENGAFSGAISGAITGAMGFAFVGSSGVSLNLWQTVLIGGTSSGGASLLGDLGDKYIKGEDISFGDIFINTVVSFGTGAMFAAVSYGAGKVVTSIKQKVFPSKNIQNAPYIKDGKPNGRPSPTGKEKEKFINELYNKQVGKDGILRDPNTGEIIPWKPGDKMKGIVDIGHKSGKEYIKAFRKYQSGQWSLDKLKAFQSNTKNFYLEAARSNRSHVFEGVSIFEFIFSKNIPWISTLSLPKMGGK